MDKFIERQRDTLILLARILLMVVFLKSGWDKLSGFQATVGYLASLNAPAPQLATVVAIFMEVFVAIALVLGLWVRPLALAMALFALGTAFIGHPFWSMEGTDRAMNLIHFNKNLAIIGGLLLLAVTGAGRYALGRHRT